MIRKDALPDDTVATIKNILRKNRIETAISNVKSFEGGWYSCTLELSGINNVATNGKGIELSYAYASAYAEMLERLQSGFLLDDLFPEKDRNQYDEDVSENEIIKIYNTYFDNVIQENENEIKKLLRYNNKFVKLHSYFDVKEKKIIKLPDKFIGALCGSNGLSSGNTKEEAYVQGVCEVFERYVNYIVHHEFYDANRFPIIEEKYFLHTYAYTLIKKVEKKGYKVLIKDCTLNGLLPVIGVLVINVSKTKYYFAIGSDINLDIAIQRCITEMFQGKDINIDFRYHMHSFIGEYERFWYLKNKRTEYAKSIKNGSGKLPRNFFLGEIKNYTNGIIHPFVDDKISNKDAVVRINAILCKLNVKVYIKDYSYLGFDTLRIYIPGMSETPLWKGDSVLKMHNDYYGFMKSYKCLDYENMAKYMSTLVKNPVFSGEYSLSTLLKINTNKEIGCIVDKDVRFFLTIINLYLNRFDEALGYLRQYHEICNIDPRKAYLQNISIEAVIYNINQVQFDQFIKYTLKSNEMEECVYFYNMFCQIRDNKIDIVQCDVCNMCVIRQKCNYTNWLTISENIHQKRDYYEVSYLYNDLFYSNISQDF